MNLGSFIHRVAYLAGTRLETFHITTTISLDWSRSYIWRSTGDQRTKGSNLIESRCAKIIQVSRSNECVLADTRGLSLSVCKRMKRVVAIFLLRPCHPPRFVPTPHPSLSRPLLSLSLPRAHAMIFLLRGPEVVLSHLCHFSTLYRVRGSGLLANCRSNGHPFWTGRFLFGRWWWWFAF